ncbi:hypothetical protein OIU34_22735 [Pararhizobium sp. BT-229]|uniref:tellurite resistance TerB C-terminal domain-containing protein n=1 Tax=Pararhizobium sp. BT-229 TaxID=2986923 RepID=UPI0021F6AD2B|nr:tellurite resistance TerB C-terminal domain-containing protein [Pararhizobium sp. BT-229]MCV9964711.1 hypothetical protein [Pararhizobium sp. BT-229]
MEFEDVTPIMILGETRVISEGKLLVFVGSEAGVPVSRAPDIALVLLDRDKKPLMMGSAVSPATPVRRDRAARHLCETIHGDRWYGSLFEISTLLMPAAAAAVSVVADGIDQVKGPLIATVEDGLSRQHLFTMAVSAGHQTAVITSIYRHGDDWKVRAYGHAYATDRHALCRQLGIGEAWPRPHRPSEPRSVPPPRAPLPATSAPRAPRSVPPVSARGGSVPPSPRGASPATPPPIDLARLSAIEKDTAAVSSLLSDIFSDVKDAPPPPPRPVSGIAGLDEAHASVLAELMARGEMETDAFAALARKHGLMPSGAAEAINDWAFDKVGDIVVAEEPSGYIFVNEHRAALEA